MSKLTGEDKIEIYLCFIIDNIPSLTLIERKKSHNLFKNRELWAF
ncbi:hypothetical protein [Fusobacterium animalis]